MSNEQLVEMIQGEEDEAKRKELLLALWESVKRLVSLRAWTFVEQIKQQDCFEDIMQESFLALCEAVNYYDSTKGK